MTRPEDSFIAFTKHVWLITPSSGDQSGSATQSPYNDTFIFSMWHPENNFTKASDFTATVSQTGEPDMGKGTTDQGQGPVRLWMTPFTGQPCLARCVTQPHPAFLCTVYSLALRGQLEQVRPVTSFVMPFLWLVGNDRTVFGWVVQYLMRQSGANLGLGRLGSCLGR